MHANSAWDRPEWYGLSFEEPNVIAVTVHPTIWPAVVGSLTKRVSSLREKKAEPPANLYREKMIRIAEQFTLPSLTEPKETDGAFGFQNTCFSYQHDEQGWVCRFYLPGHQEKERGRAHATTLNWLCNSLWLIGGDDNIPKPKGRHRQLVVVEDICYTGGYNELGVGISITPTLARWIAAQPQTQRVPIVEQAIASMYRWMVGGKLELLGHECCCSFGQYFGVYLRCPGNACELGGGGPVDPNDGYCLGPHNVDCFPQEFALLAGVAKLCDLARADLG
ncbi:TPA: hypothetical protein DHW58_00530 [Patescibacteria group bacterium]|uniref:Uncharacterized protein n=2 Tax=Bacteria division Kazan-3B-28 TaxID=1798534 RepID=A0A0G1X6Z7_UNCK3|nr:MAG: hypothetical protein VE98_C0001G0288 [candidate division Kazan bacterium GW2011_GWA1_50_15]KKW25435.1 MAG: hypothetical protein VE99_C0001G0072 [candidate division Kazan bacterium GW2011_GWC1_52_13]KKW26741.1 MAG: hypothetical protein VF00_C0002G0066 [candidate division Kazan bacterium GW2011_GWB1_52_7]HAV65738.1 hypothetical protein [Patescibacteria group bacterium]HCL47464.1 hypothetical protein [Patescibacteria group bacterium]